MKSLKKNLNSIIVGLILTFLFTTLVNPKFPTVKKSLDRIEGIIYDLRLNATLPEQVRKSEHNIFVVDIDEKALKEIGRFPWSRTIVKDLVTKLVDAGVVVIGFDVTFSEPEVNPVDKLLNSELGKNLYQKNSEYFSQLRQELDADLQLASVLGDTDIVVGVLFHDQENIQAGTLKEPSVVLLDQNAKKVTTRIYPGQTANIDAIRDAAIGQGFFNSSPDQDGFIRRALTVIEHKEKLYPSLALEAARLYTLSDKVEIETEKLPSSNYNTITAVRFGKTRIPTDEFGQVLIPFRGGQKSFPYYSAADILKERIDPELLESGIALVGTSAVGLADLRATSVGLQYPGVEVHANVLEGILQPGLFSYRPDWWQGSLYLQIIITGLLLTFILPILGPLKMALVGAGTLVSIVIFNLYLWNEHIELPITQPLALAFFITIYNLSRGFFNESSNRQQIKSMFDQYVPPAHIDKMLTDPSSVSLEGERKKMSVLFSDIRNFTSISEKLSANELKDMLNEYFSPITKSIFEHQGTIDKYVGDMVMAFWGAPLDDPNHAHNAVIGGFNMLKITRELREEFIKRDWPEIYVGIGINTGDMNVGDMGSEYRRSYTVLGDAVNLGSRLEGLTKYYGLEFLVSEYTKQQCPDIAFFPVDKVKVKGKEEAVAIFEPICEKNAVDDKLAQELTLLDTAYQSYLSQHWHDAKAQYQQLVEMNPSKKLYALYLERIALLEHENLGENWNGSFTHTGK